MYPSQTSLIPVTVALVKFYERYGLSAFNNLYPYWYLGTTPYRFLIGPLVPILISLIHNLFVNAALFTITIYLIIFSFLVSAISWTFLLLVIAGSKITWKKLWPAFIFLLLPWKYFSSFTLDEGTMALAKNILPLALITFWLYLSKKNRRSLVLSAFAVLVILLVNTQALPDLLVGIIALAVTFSYKEGKLKGIERNLKSVFWPFSIGLTLATLWYTPSYWITILSNPSIGGLSGLGAILRIFDLLRALVPLVLAIVVVSFSSKIKSRTGIFAFVWFLTFVFLISYRFLANPAFWQDWTSWFYEAEVGIFLLIFYFWPKFSFWKAVLVILPFWATFYFYVKLGSPRLLSQSLPAGIESIKAISETAQGKRVFLSGSTVFWANSLYDIYQVRGGRDEVSHDSNWQKLAWVLRESQDSEEIRGAIAGLGVSFVLIHTKDSLEYYHDFKNENVWKSLGKVVWEGGGDIIYSF